MDKRLINQSGIISLLTTIFVALVLIVITTSAVMVVSREQRTALDADLSNRAYYAAEAGVENAIAKIKADWAVDGEVDPIESCDGVPPELKAPQFAGPDADAEVTCQIITATTGSTGNRSLGAEESTQYDVRGVDFYRISLYWNLYGIANARNDTEVGNFSLLSGEFPSLSNWPLKAPAVIELTIISYPDKPQVSLSEITHKEIIIKPYYVPTHRGLGLNLFGNYLNINSPVDGRCSNDQIDPTHYNCIIEFEGFDPNNNYIVRLRPRYRRANVMLFFRDDPSTNFEIIEIRDGINIDVTARANDVYRRIVTKINAQPGDAANAINVLDYVIISDRDICKNFRVSGVSDRATEQDACSGFSF